MTTKTLTVLHARPVHPGRGEPSYITLVIALDYMKAAPVVDVPLSPDKALELAEQLVHAARIVGRV